MTQEGREGWAEQSRVRATEPRSHQGLSEARETPARPKVLARLPDLDVAELDKIVEVHPSGSRMRTASQRLSTAVLIGVGVLFFVVAVQPFVGGNKDWKPENPAPAAPVAPTWNSSLAQTPGAEDPAAKIPLQPQIPALPDSIPSLSPSIPAVPASIQGPSGVNPPPAQATPSTPLPWNPQSQQMPPSGTPNGYVMNGPASYTAQVSHGTPDATAFVASRPENPWNASPSSGGVTYPSTPYVNSFETIPTSGTMPPSSAAASNRPVTLGSQPMGPGMVHDTRSSGVQPMLPASRSSAGVVGTAEINSGSYPAGYVAPGSSFPNNSLPSHANPVLPASRWSAGGVGSAEIQGPAAGGYVPPANTAAGAQSTTYPAVAEPGVARLQGVIEKSTTRPYNDSPRSSLY